MKSTDEAGACTSRSRGASSLAMRRRVFLVLALAGAACTDGGDPAGLVGAADSGQTGAAANSTGTGGSTSVCANGTAVADPANNAALVADCEMLLSVKDSLRGTGALNWDAGTAIGEWDGVRVWASPPTRVERVRSIELRERNLTGVIPGGLGSVDGLTELKLEYNDLTGAIPAELGELDELGTLWLYGNDLTGAIPAELTEAGKLSWLDLRQNRLEGTIPSGLGDLPLRHLRLGHNELTGEIPAELGDIRGLRFLYLQDNELTARSRRSWGRCPRCRTCC